MAAAFTPFAVARAAQQAAFYAARGSQAFGAHAVPWRLSTGWATADVVARTAEALYRRGARAVKVVDLGAGTGRLGFHVAVLLAARGVPARVVLTEAAASMVAGWRAHPQLAPLLEDGLVEAAQVDVLQPASLAPVVETRDGEALLLVGTYLFDTLAHELVERRPDGTLWRGGEDETGALVFERPATPFLPPSVALPPFDGEGAARCFVPTGALQAIAAVEAARVEPCWWLVADKGPLRAADAWEHGPLRVVSHDGAWSVAVNFPVLAQALTPRPWLAAPANAAAFSIHLVGLGGASPEDGAALTSALAETPHPLAALHETLAAVAAPLRPDALLALRPTGDALMNAADVLRATDALPDDTRLALGRWVLAAVESTFIVPADDVCFHAGTVLQRLGLLDAAVWAYAESVARYGAHASAHFNGALCLLDLGRPDDARRQLQAALAVDPSHARAAALLQSL